jgi:opacity protein-like surface antigen
MKHPQYAASKGADVDARGHDPRGAWRHPSMRSTLSRFAPLRGPVLLVGVLLLASPGIAQDYDDGYGDRDWYSEAPADYGSPRASTVSVRGAVGITSDPSMFALGLGFPIEINRRVAFTPMIQAAFDDDHTIIAPTVNLEYHLDLSDGSSDLLRRLHPFVQGGIGFAYIHKEQPGNDPDEVGFLLAPGLGLEYELTDNLLIGSNVLFNILPSEVSDENFFLTWQFATLRVRF